MLTLQRFAFDDQQVAWGVLILAIWTGEMLGRSSIVCVMRHDPLAVDTFSRLLIEACEAHMCLSCVYRLTESARAWAAMPIVSRVRNADTKRPTCIDE
jgi:hypothetical protein